MPFVPPDAADRRYREPFLGGATFFFALCPRDSYLSDANEYLVSCYSHIRDCPGTVSDALTKLVRNNSSNQYYAVREAYNLSSPSASQAARFIYLNRTSFNGIFRVNLRGDYNVPYGKKPHPIFPTRAHLREASAALSNARLATQDYKVALAGAAPGDFVYLDPPYPPLNGTSYFSHYTADRFGTAEQTAVAAEFQRLHELGCEVMMTNADTTEIRRLYRHFHCHQIPVTRYVTCRSSKHKVNELVITNYRPAL